MDARPDHKNSPKELAKMAQGGAKRNPGIANNSSLSPGGLSEPIHSNNPVNPRSRRPTLNSLIPHTK